MESRGNPVIGNVTKETMPEAWRSPTLGGSNCCSHRWKPWQTRREKPVGTSVGIDARGLPEIEV